MISVVWLVINVVSRFFRIGVRRGVFRRTLRVNRWSLCGQWCDRLSPWVIQVRTLLSGRLLGLTLCSGVSYRLSSLLSSVRRTVLPEGKQHSMPGPESLVFLVTWLTAMLVQLPSENVLSVVLRTVRWPWARAWACRVLELGTVFP